MTKTSINASMHAKVLAVVSPGARNTRNVSCVCREYWKHVSEVERGMNTAAEGVRSDTKVFKTIWTIATLFHAFVCIRKWSRNRGACWVMCSSSVDCFQSSATRWTYHRSSVNMNVSSMKMERGGHHADHTNVDLTIPVPKCVGGMQVVHVSSLMMNH